MNYIREFLYRPKRSDRSLLARFFFADEALNSVTSELDSFDGQKDPERCAALVSKLRGCQDKMLNICNYMLEELEPGSTKELREFRAKFPDDVLHDNLAGQLWFGAECLAAGSSIMNKETESDEMRPLAKAVTKSLEKVRTLLREQCLSPMPEYSEKIREHLKIFDRLFSEFEFQYVQCMVHVKTIREYELHQELIVLFSDTLTRALSRNLVTQDMVDYCDPSLMFAIPRLAIIMGLLIQPDGPLNVDRTNINFPELFLPFKNLLKKMRNLLLTLDPPELMVLEMLLCQQEEPANLSAKLKEVQAHMVQKEKEEQAFKLTAKLSGSEEIVEPIMDAVLSVVMDVVLPGGDSADDELEEDNNKRLVTGSNSTLPVLKRVNAKKESSKRVSFAWQKDKRSRFKSTEDLLHRLYVCISGAADQLQSNYAGDFRSILRTVFVMNCNDDEEENDHVPDEDFEASSGQSEDDWGTEALEHLSAEVASTEIPVGGDTYARNLSYAQEDLVDDSSRVTEFYRDEPALLNIASGSEESPSQERKSPPVWVPDEVSPYCMGCSESFSLFKRRHHCRSCGLVFCFRCSGQTVPLPHYGIDKPVRVCDRCYIFSKGRRGTPNGSNLWTRNVGMVS